MLALHTLLKALPWQVGASVEMPARLKEGRSQSQMPSTPPV